MCAIKNKGQATAWHALAEESFACARCLTGTYTFKWNKIDWNHQYREFKILLVFAKHKIEYKLFKIVVLESDLQIYKGTYALCMHSPSNAMRNAQCVCAADTHTHCTPCCTDVRQIEEEANRNKTKICHPFGEIVDKMCDGHKIKRERSPNDTDTDPTELDWTCCKLCDIFVVRCKYVSSSHKPFAA